MILNYLSPVVSPVTYRIERLSPTQFAYLLVLPVLLIMSVVAFWPLLRTFEISLHSDQLTGATAVGEFVGLRNYVALFSGDRAAVMPQPFLNVEEPLSSSLIVTFLFAIVSVAIETVLGFGQAIVLDQDFRGRRWVRTAILIPWAVPIVIQGMIFFLMFSPGIGFAVEPLHQLGLFSLTPLNDTGSSLAIIVVADVWKTTPFMALLILAGLQSIDRQLYDVARMSGASRWQQFKTITFPLVLPSVLVAMLFRSIAALRVFGLIETVSSCSTVPSLSCMVVSTFNSQRFGTSAAIAFVTAGVIGIAVSIYIAKFARSERGAV
ncbi:ABC transporter permease [Halobacteriales archaeon QS_6_71_20]|nr:MAG: ABC transporter permease [Halobacteriales archaeon QS_6_71_20]